ncbi:MAG: rRNA maturation RNase YbeY [Geminicoccaceae bacterium]
MDDDSSPRNSLAVAVDWPLSEAALEALCHRAREALETELDLSDDLRQTQISFLFTDDAAIADLNFTYRGKERPTNVLSFPLLDGTEDQNARPGERLLGDIVLALETVSAEAAASSRPIDEHLSHLLIHGHLHLLGYDHGQADDASAMERIEIRALGRLGIADPYATGAEPVEVGAPSHA